MNKVCSKCKEDKSVKSFNRNKRMKDGLQNQCRDCHNSAQGDSYKRHSIKRDLRYHKRKHKPIVYLMPNENYVGTTENLYYRLREHEKLGRDVSGVRTLHEFEDRATALKFERFMHEQGYEGKHKFNMYR